jgi:hypothetical protein
MTGTQETFTARDIFELTGETVTQWRYNKLFEAFNRKHALENEQIQALLRSYYRMKNPTKKAEVWRQFREIRDRLDDLPDNPDLLFPTDDDGAFLADKQPSAEQTLVC